VRAESAIQGGSSSIKSKGCISIGFFLVGPFLSL
jgi:hypothetical protein